MLKRIFGVRGTKAEGEVDRHLIVYQRPAAEVSQAEKTYQVETAKHASLGTGSITVRTGGSGR